MLKLPKFISDSLNNIIKLDKPEIVKKYILKMFDSDDVFITQEYYSTFKECREAGDLYRGKHRIYLVLNRKKNTSPMRPTSSDTMDFRVG